MKIILLFLLFILLASGFTNKNKDAESLNEKYADFDEVDSLAAANLTGYVAFDHSADKWIHFIDGEFINSAKTTAYKNIEVNVEFHSEEGGILREKQFILNDSILPKEKKQVHFTNFDCKELSKDKQYVIAWHLIDATPYLPKK